MLCHTLNLINFIDTDLSSFGIALNTYLESQPSFPPDVDVGDATVILEEMLGFWPVTKLLQLLGRYGLRVPVPLVIEDENESVGVGVS